MVISPLCFVNMYKIQNNFEVSMLPNEISCHFIIKAETHDATNRCDTSPRQIAATNLPVWHVIVAAIGLCLAICRKNSNWFEFVRQISATKEAQAALSQRVYASAISRCDKLNLNQSMREHQLVSCHVKFELVYISSLPKSIACKSLMAATCRSSSEDEATCRRDVSQRFVASQLCLGLKVLYVKRIKRPNACIATSWY